MSTQSLFNQPLVQAKSAPSSLIDRSWLSKYIHMVFAWERLLYWKAVSRHLDGRTNVNYSINFCLAQPRTFLSLLASGSKVECM